MGERRGGQEVGCESDSGVVTAEGWNGKFVFKKFGDA